jgi:hypothetical protein
MLQHQQSQHHLRRRARPSSTSAVRPSPSQDLHDMIDQRIVIEKLVFSNARSRD